MSLDTVLLAVGESQTDGVEQLAETAIDLAGPAGATVVLAQIFSEDAYNDARDRLQFDPDGNVTPSLVAERNVRIRDLSEQLADAGVEYTVQARLTDGNSEGDRFAELADDTGSDLVIVGGRGRTPTGKAVFGSTAQTIMLSAPCPVTFVRSE